MILDTFKISTKQINFFYNTWRIIVTILIADIISPISLFVANSFKYDSELIWNGVLLFAPVGLIIGSIWHMLRAKQNENIEFIYYFFYYLLPIVALSISGGCALSLIECTRG